MEELTMNTIHNQESIIKAMDQLFSDLISAWAEGNVTDDYKSSVCEELRKAYAVAVKNYPGNKR